MLFWIPLKILRVNLILATVDEIAFMNYRVRRQGEELGVYSLEELRRRHSTGEFTGAEYIQGERMSDWQPLELVLQQGYRIAPPPLPSSVAVAGPNHAVVWGIVALGVVLFAVFVSLLVQNVRKGYFSALNRAGSQRFLNEPRPQAVAAASKPVLWTTNTLTQTDASERAREFRIRQWLDGYDERGRRNPAVDAEAEQFIRVWIARSYGGAEATNALSLAAESDRLANNPDCTDPLVLTVAANESSKRSDSNSRFERALAAYPASQHKAYPQLYAMVWLAAQAGTNSSRPDELRAPALEQLQKCFADGSFTPDDQQEIAEIFVNGWGRNFLSGNGDSICKIAHEAGTNYQWFALVLEGQNEINEAWKARGNGYANAVTEDGWHGFRSHLSAARNALTEASNLQPDFPLAPCLMMTVSLGDSDITEMRAWFDRTVAAQIDYPGAWSEMRWGLRPDWYGNEVAMLALGKTAINTGRFDTDVPRKFIDCVYDVESEEGIPAGRHIFGRSDIWPLLEKIYQGYIAAPSQEQQRNGWRTSYAVIAYHAGKYDVARTQLEALNWTPQPNIVGQWRLDPTLWTLEIAARTGPQGREISAAEASYQKRDFTEALKQYNDLNSAAVTNERTKEFIKHRLAMLQQP